MLTRFRRLGLAAAMTVAIAGTTIALPDAAQARWGGGWHGGGWHGGGGWGWGGLGIGLGTGLLLGAATAPYWGGYGYGYPYYGGYGGGPYYAAYGAPYAGGCYVTRRWVINGYGHRVWRRVRVCG
jgi:hypothetical protein